MKKLIYILSIILIISLGLNVYQCNRKKDKEYINIEKEVIVEKTDTIIQTKLKTDTIYFNDIQYKTINVRDTVWIEAKNREYKDSTEDYDITINAVKLNNYQLNIHKRDTITFTKEIIKNVYNKKKQNRFTHGISLGFGYGFINRKPDLFLGYSIQYSF